MVTLATRLLAGGGVKVGGWCDEIPVMGVLVGLKGSVSLLFLTFFWFFFNVFLGSLDAEGGNTVVGGSVSSPEMFEYLDVGVISSLQLDIMRLSNMGVNVRA